MSRKFTRAELEAYLDESLPPKEMVAIESAFRSQPELARQLAEINGIRTAGLHSLADIWRRHRISCPTRQQLGSFLLGVLPDEHAQYVQFHIEVVGCRFCEANLTDLRREQVEGLEATARRCRKYYDTTAGYLRGE